MHRIRIRQVLALLGATALLALSAGSAMAHVIEHAGSYTIALGWKTEPAYVGEQNAVQVIATDGSGKPVIDLGPDDLKVVVSTGGQQSGELTFDNGFDEDTGLGVRGDYEASLLPTAVGNYTFHLTGTIHGTTVDFTETSSDQTFNAVVGTSDIQFPVQVPAMDAVVTRLDRIDQRIAALGTPGGATTGPTQDAVNAAAASAADARQAADRALLVGGGIGLAGLLVGGLGLIVAMRAGRSARARAA